MKNRIAAWYHTGASYLLLARYFLTLAVCSNCTFDDATGMPVLCNKHHKKLFLMEGRAYEHFDRSQELV